MTKPSASRVASRYAKITVPPRDFKRYLQMFGKRVKALKEAAAKMERVCEHEDARYWLTDSTRRDFDPCAGWLGLLADKVEYLSGLDEAIDLFRDQYGGVKKVIGFAEEASEVAQDYADRVEREAKKIREYKPELDENLEYYKDYVPRDLVDAVYWLGSREWQTFHKMLSEAPERIKSLLTQLTPPETEEVETLYHASVDAKPLLRSGFNPQGKGGMGLGGSTDTDSGKPAISFTYDLYIAKEIARTLKEGVLVAHGKVSPQEVLGWAEKAGFKDKVVETAQHTYFNRGIWEDPSKRVEHAMAYWYTYLGYAGRAGKRYNPVFWTGPKYLIPQFKRVKYGDIGVLVADVNMTDPDITYKPAEREYRVPVSAIVDLKKVIQ
jgi:hypothetical protein